MCHACPTHVLRIHYDLSTEKIHYTTATLCNNTLPFLTRTVVRCGRSFVSRIYATAAKLQELEYFTDLSKDFSSDLSWWHTLLAEWNGISLLRYLKVSGFNYHGMKDANHWELWLRSFPPLYYVLLHVWGSKLVKKCVLFQYDNLSLVQALKKSLAKDCLVM